MMYARFALKKKKRQIQINRVASIFLKTRSSFILTYKRAHARARIYCPAKYRNAN